MKKKLLVLGLGAIMAVSAAATANDWNFSGMLQSENSYGESMYEDKVKEYEVELQFRANKQINDKMKVNLNFSNKEYFGSKANGRDRIWLREASIDYKVSDALTINVGSKPIWLGYGGMFADSYVKGVDFMYQVSPVLSTRLYLGRQTGDGDRANVAYGEVSYSGIKNLGLTLAVSAGNHPEEAAGFSGPSVDKDGNHLGNRGNTLKADEDSVIIGGSAAYQMGKFGAAVQIQKQLGDVVEGADDDTMAFGILTSYQATDKLGLYLRYFNRGGDLNPAFETGEYMSWWGDKMRSNVSYDGFRFIAAYPLLPNVGLEVFYGMYSADTSDVDYKAEKAARALDGKTTGDTATKYGFALTASF